MTFGDAPAAPAYDRIGGDYARVRRADPRIAAAIDAALGDARTVVNVGAGAGSYEPRDREVLAVEPSSVMIAQRPADAAPYIQTSAEALSLADASYDAAMAVLTIHHWADAEAGLRELRRVARHRVLLLTWVPDAPDFWLTRDYFPEIAEQDRGQFPPTYHMRALLERTIGSVAIETIAIPADCTDGFLMAYWRRPEAYLDRAIRAGISSFHRFDAAPGLTRLADDLATGNWERRNADILDRDALDLGYRLFVCDADSLTEQSPAPTR